MIYVITSFQRCKITSFDTRSMQQTHHTDRRDSKGIVGVNVIKLMLFSGVNTDQLGVGNMNTIFYHDIYKSQC